MNRMLFLKELKENKWILLVMFLVSLLFIGIYPVNYRELFGILLDRQLNYANYLWSGWFSVTQLQIMLVGCIVMGSVSFSKEARRGTFSCLTVRPVSRKSILLVKLVTGALSIFSMLLVNTLLLVFYSDAMGIDTGAIGLYFLAGFLVLLLLLPVYLMSAMFSVVFMDGLKAALVSTVITTLTYGLAWFGLRYSIIYLIMKDFYRFNPVPSVFMAASCGIFISISLLLFNRKEL